MSTSNTSRPTTASLLRSTPLSPVDANAEAFHLPGTPVEAKNNAKKDLRAAQDALKIQQQRLQKISGLIGKVKDEYDGGKKKAKDSPLMRMLKGPNPGRQVSPFKKGHVVTIDASPSVQKAWGSMKGKSTASAASTADKDIKSSASLCMAKIIEVEACEGNTKEDDDDAAADKAVAPAEVTSVVPVDPVLLSDEEEVTDDEANDCDQVANYAQEAQTKSEPQPEICVSDDGYTEVMTAQEQSAEEEAQYIDVGDHLPHADPTYEVPDQDVENDDADAAMAAHFGILDGNFLQVHKAAYMGKSDRLDGLINAGHDLHEVDEQGRTALMYAIHGDQIEMVHKLAACGVDMDQQANDGSTALHHAAFSHSFEIFCALLSNGASPLVVDQEGRTALHWSCFNRNTKCMSTLIKHFNDVNVNTVDGAGMTPAMWAAYYNKPVHLSKLIHYGADIHAQDVEGKTALMWAVNSEGSSCFKMLLSKVSNKLTDVYGKSIIHYAAEYNSKSAVRLAIQSRPACIEDDDANGRTALHWAAVYGHADAAHALLKAGIDSSLTDGHGYTAFDYAIENNHINIVDLIASAKKINKPSEGGPRVAEVQEYSQEFLDSYVDEDSEGNALPSESAHEVYIRLTHGGYINKFTNNGKGSSHPRYFWVDAYTGELCWHKSPADFARNPQAVNAIRVVGLLSTANATVMSRRGYDAHGKHRYSFTIKGQERDICLFTDSEEDYRMWMDGLQCMLAFGEELVSLPPEYPAAEPDMEWNGQNWESLGNLEESIFSPAKGVDTVPNPMAQTGYNVGLLKPRGLTAVEGKAPESPSHDCFV